MANKNSQLFDDNICGSPSAQHMRMLRKEDSTVAAMNKNLIPEGGRGQNDKILDTTRQGRTMETLKPQCPPNPGIIVGK